MSNDAILEFTGSYQEWLMKSLKDKAGAGAYLRFHLDEYEKGVPSIPDERLLKIFRRALQNVLEATK